MNDKNLISGSYAIQTISVPRRVFGYGTIAAAAPYIFIKINWLAGGTLGMNDPTFFANPTYLFANAITFLMDVLAVLLALALTEKWGMRLPPLTVLFPMWAASGLLLPIVFILLFSPLARQTTVAAHSENNLEPLQSWVFMMVYGCFAAQGILLSGTFALYARARWGKLVVQLKTAKNTAATHDLTRFSAGAAAVLSTFAGICGAAWSAGVDLGALSVAPNAKSGIFYLTSAIHAAFAFAAAIGALLLFYFVSKPRALNWWLILSLIWIGSAAMFTWSGWEIFTSLGINSELNSPAANFLRAIKICAALLLAVTSAFVVVQRAEQQSNNKV